MMKLIINASIVSTANKFRQITIIPTSCCVCDCVLQTLINFIFYFLKKKKKRGGKVSGDLANEEARGLDFRSEDKVGSTGDHVDVMPRRNQIPHNLNIVSNVVKSISNQFKSQL